MKSFSYSSFKLCFKGMKQPFCKLLNINNLSKNFVSAMKQAKTLKY